MRAALVLVMLTLLLCALSSKVAAAKVSSSSEGRSDGAVWQTMGDSRSIIEESFYEDKPPIIFSPSGRLFPVERIVRAAKTHANPRANLLIALKCQDGIVVLSTVPTSPFLNTTVNNTLFLLDDTEDAVIYDYDLDLVTATAGNAADGKVLQSKIQAFVEHSMENHKDNVVPSEIARNLADHLQGPTQTIGGRAGPLLAVRIL